MRQALPGLKLARRLSPALAVWFGSLLGTPELASAAAPGRAVHMGGRAAPLELPFELDDHRIIALVTLIGHKGQRVSARAWIDSGTPDLLLSKDLAERLGLRGRKPGPGFDQSYGPALVAPAPAVRAGQGAIDTKGLEAIIPDSPGQIFPGVPADLDLPATVLERYDLVIDYEQRRLILAPKGHTRFQGLKIPGELEPRTGIMTVRARLGDEPVNLSLDTGAAATWVRRDLAEQLAKRFPTGGVGAVGDAQLFGTKLEVEGLQLCGVSLELGQTIRTGTGLLGVDREMMDWYSTKSRAPVVGFLGGETLENYRIGIDYRSSMTYWRRSASRRPISKERVLATLRPDPEGKYQIVAVRADSKAASAIRTGDMLVSVDGAPIRGWTLGRTMTALAGSADATHKLELARSGTRITARVAVEPICSSRI